MTTWHRPCDTASCLEVHEDGGQVHVRQSDRPDVVVTLTRAEWDAHLDEVRAPLVAENARLRQQVDDTKAACAGHVSATLLDGMVSVDDLDATLEQHRHACQTIAAMQPVVDAAAAWRAKNRLDPSLMSPRVAAMAVAVDVYEKAYPAPLSPTEAAQEVEEALRRLRERREAQGGSQGDGEVVYHRTSGAKDEYLQRAHPVEVAGLEEAAIEMWQVAGRHTPGTAWVDIAPGRQDWYRHLARAAAPILVRAALLEAAEEVEQSGSRFEVEDPAGLLAEWLRDRADRQVGSNG